MEAHEELILKVLAKEVSCAQDNLFRHRLELKSRMKQQQTAYMPRNSILRAKAKVKEAEERVSDLESAILWVKNTRGNKS